MTRGSIFAGLVAAAALALALAAPAGAAASKPKPVASLQPQATAKLWRQLVQRRHVQARSDCTPLRLVFYAATDWLRLATKLAATQAPCAQYYISIAPLAADKTTFRYDQPWRIRALGPNFHAMAEISYKGWGSWVTSNGGSWYAAGVEARRRMAAQGFDVNAGDIWAVNEASSAVRTGTGAARQNLRELVRGLYDAGGGPAVKGTMFVIGVGQSATNLSTYKGTLQMWYGDSAFWNDMQAYVSDWSQEVYGDIRNYAVAGAPVAQRRDELNAWLQHPLSLAEAGPAEIATAKSFLQSAYTPLANAAWRYAAGAGFGWTDVAYDQMEDYVSAQTYAAGSAGSHFGFAWDPNRPADVTPTQFSAESGAVLDRLAAAIRDSATIPAAACAEWCAGAIDGASFNEAWKDLATWSAPSLVFANAPTSSVAGGVAGPLTVSLQLVGVTRPDTQPVTVTLSSSSFGGMFAATADGPWASTLAGTIPTGSTDVVFYYRDAVAGRPTIVASAPGRTSAQQVETVASAPVAPTEPPPPAEPPASPPPPPADPQPVEPPAAQPVPSASAPAKPRATRTPVVSARLAFLAAHRRLVVVVRVVDARGRRVANAHVRLALRHDGRWITAASLRTSLRGTASVSRSLRRGCYAVKLTRVTARGFAWNGVTPKNGFCARRT